jgi:small GTP-binding protein
MSSSNINRLHICFYGRTNVGKSSIINLITSQSVSIVSEIPGTTTDKVSKAMELKNVGPVLLVDTAGIDDGTDLGIHRKQKTLNTLGECDFAFLVIEPNK